MNHSVCVHGEVCVTDVCLTATEEEEDSSLYVLFCRCVCFSHPESESEQLQQHLHREESGEHHVEDVHDVAESFRLFVVLQHTNKDFRT